MRKKGPMWGELQMPLLHPSLTMPYYPSEYAYAPRQSCA